ncbi:MAG: hypothetical protein M3322_04275 [Actinomycetota bacterium]|nr:hypothetical protein [Actinomycetota bacterium]
MVLRASDLPPGFVVVASETGLRTNRDLVRDQGTRTARKLERWGRITGYVATFKQRDVQKGTLPGVVNFIATVAVFRTAAGAHAALTDASSPCRRKHMTRIPLAGHRPVGQDTLVCGRGLRVRGVRIRLFLVQWRNGRAAGLTGVTALEGAATPLTALTAARRQSRRMSAELHRGRG